MFIGDKYYNRLNISTIKYSVTNDVQEFEVRKIFNSKEDSRKFWIYNKTKNEIYEHRDNEHWNRKKFKLLDDDKLKSLKEKYDKIKMYQEQYEKLDREQRNSYSRSGIRQFNSNDLHTAEENYQVATKNYSIQKQFFATNLVFNFVYIEGYIMTYIKMNNGDTFEEKILYWCNKESLKDSKIQTDSLIKKKYEDEDVNIKFVLKTLNNNKLENKVMI